MKHSKTSFMKRWLLGLSLCACIISTAEAESVKIDGLYYELNTNDRTATLTYETTTSANYASLQSVVQIPSQVTYSNVQFTVTTIADRAFANCTALESVIIPASVKTIGSTYSANNSNNSYSATYLPFYNCTSLKIVKFEDGNDAITLGCYYNTNNSSAYYGKGLFYYCPLEEVYIGRNIQYKDYNSIYTFDSYSYKYGYSAFYNQPKLTKVTIGDLVTEIPAYLFYQSSAITIVEFGNSLENVPKYSFYGCTNLQAGPQAETITEIGEYAFFNCNSLKSIYLGHTQTIGQFAFYGTDSLTNVTFPSTLTSIGIKAFNASGISSLSLPSSVTSIGNNAFDSSKVISVEFGNNDIELGTGIFFNCIQLTKAVIGNGITTIPDQTFSDCEMLADITIGSSITTIADRAFANCTALETIVIPASVKTIGSTYSENNSNNSYSATYLPFYNCTSLKIVKFEDGNDVITLGCNYNTNNSSAYYGKGLFYYCPLEEVYIGRNIQYKDYNSIYTFDSYSYKYGYSAFYNQPKLTKVTIGDLVTDITPYLFYNNSSLTLMSLPHVKNIGKSAFESCSKLTTLNLGDAVETVGERAFYYDGNITKLTFPNTTKSIGNYAFCQNTSVTEVTVGTGLESIGAYAFYGDKSFTALILPDGFTTMGESAFEGCSKLTVAKLGESLTTVPAKAFKDCPSLSEMVIPATAESIGDQAFYNDSGLATITMREGLKTIGNEVFWNNSGIMTFTIPGTVTSMGRNCFYGCTRVMYLTFSDGEETLVINNSNCRSAKIEALTSNSSYTNRYYDYFYDCPIRFLTLGRNLTYSYKDSQSMYDVNGTSFRSVTRATAPFVNNTTIVAVTIGPKVTFLYHHLLNGCSSISALTMSDGMQQIYSYALANCTGLKELTFPNPLILFDNYACANNINLASIVFNEEPGNNLNMTIGTYAMSNCPMLTELTFPAKTTSIGNYCFYQTNGLKEITFVNSKNEITLGYGAKADALQNITSDSRMPLFGNSRLEKLYMGRNITYQLPSNLTATSGDYGYSPFYNQTFLTDVKFSQTGTVTSCKSYLLYYVNNCEELTLPESLTDIGSYTFAQMQKLNGITIPNKVTTIGTYAFAYDTELQYANLSTACPWLKEGVFSGCSTLEAITIPPVVTKMDAKLFANCTSLATAIFEGNFELIEMGYGASQAEYGLFRDCPVETLYLDRWLSYNTDQASRSPFYSIAELRNLTFGENVQVVDKYMFSYCTGLEEVVLPDNITSVGLWGFRGCSSLKDVKFSQKLSQVSDYGFSECTSLDNVVFPASMTSIADNSFSNCTSLKKLDLGSSLMIIGPSAFMNDTSLEGFEIPESLYGLGVEAFKGCTSLPNVTIRSISSVGARAFQDCTGIKWISLSDKTTSLGEDSFAGCSGLSYVKSYATYPPEGLVNFVEGIPENGTLFVPQASIMYYQFSPTWEDWLDIRPLNDNIMVTGITLNKNEISFKASDTDTLTATVENEDATDKGILWRTSDDTIVKVDDTGNVTAIAVGEATVTALAADGSGVKDECHVTVLPTMVEDIAIIGSSNTLKKGRTLELTASVLPVTATNSNVNWSTSDNKIAEVNGEGIVTAISAGQVQITATAEDGSTKFGTFDLTIIPPTPGDSNDNDEVTITDAVNTANFAIGNPVENFNQEAADVNGDNRITLADASGTVTIILEQPAKTSLAQMKAKALIAEINSDFLVMEDFSVKAGQSVSVPVMLDNTVEYVALQADVTVPEGMKIESVTIGNRAESNHSLITKHIDANTVRVVLFDLNNSEFADNNEPLFNINVISEEVCQGEILIDNILASDAQAHEYSLYSTGGNFSDISGIDNAYISDIYVETAENAINIFNAENREVAVFATDGTTITRFVAKANIETINVVPGIYVVSVGENAVKVIVK